MSDYISRDDLKDYLPIDHGEFDDLLQIVCTAASRAVDYYCNRRFWADTDVSARKFDIARDDKAKVDDFHTTDGLIIAVDTNDSGTFDQTWSTTDYELRPLNGIVAGLEGFPYNEIRATTRGFPCGGVRARLQVTAKWGWATVPDQVVNACLIWAAWLYKRKDTVEGFFGGAEGFDPQRIAANAPAGVTVLLNPFKKVIG